jgi:endonuclease/exonuclease/phosphatase family metal-dependent hydrolase
MLGLMSVPRVIASMLASGTLAVIRSKVRTIIRRAVLWVALLAPVSLCAGGETLRVTTWNLEWFPDKSPRPVPLEQEARNVAMAADVLRKLDSDILLLQEVRDYDVCERLAEAIKPHTYQIAICSAFKEPFQSGLGKQQVAIIAKEPAQAAWSERWKSMSGVDPPRGFAFAWFKIRGFDVGVYSLHLKSNLVTRGNKEEEEAKNIRKREVAAGQLLNHTRDVIATAMPIVHSIVVGGDFNTNRDQPMFAPEETLAIIERSGFQNCMGSLPLLKRVTHPANHGYPPATFDYLFAKGAAVGSPIITVSDVSDHYSVTCDVTLSQN